jgi:Peptidase family M28
MQTIFKPFLLLLILLTLILNVNAQVPTSIDSAMSYLKVLSDNELFEGRKSGVPSGNNSMLWIANKFEAWGLEPFIENSFEVKYSQIASVEKKGKLSLLNTTRYGDVEFLMGDDFNLCVNSGSAKITAPITFVGRGISAPEKGWDDYADIDVTGRIVVVFRGSPNKTEDWNDENSRVEIINSAVEHGAVAVLFHQGSFPIYGATIFEDGYKEDIPSFYIGERIIRHILFGTGYNYKGYKALLAKAPTSIHFDKKMKIVAKVDRIPDAFAYNVAGKIPGTDPELAHEVIMIGAHGDHSGKNALGHVFAGADDNGSGTVTIMEMARNFAQNPQPRTLVFCVFGAEEQGLLGSEAFSEILPEAYDYVNYINLDMTGRGKGVTNFGGVEHFLNIWNDFYSDLDDSIQSKISTGRTWGSYSSDHAPFRKIGIPSFTCSSTGSHSYYHSADDQYYTIHPAAIDASLITMSLWIEHISNYSEPLADAYLDARSTWHRGYPFTWLKVDSTLDIDQLTTNKNDGFVGNVLDLNLDIRSSNLKNTIETVDRYKDILKNHTKLNHQTDMDKVGGEAYKQRAAIYFSACGDSLVSSDSTAIEVLARLGLNWIRLKDMSLWIDEAGILPEKENLVKRFSNSDIILQLPLSSLPGSLSINEIVGSNTLYVGSISDFIGIDSEILKQARESDARIILNTQTSEWDMIYSQIDRLKEFKIHVQPADSGYENAMIWVRDGLATGLERDELKKLLKDHFSNWK